MNPTQKQIDYAKTIHEELGVELPIDATKRAYMSWLDENVPKYKQFCQDRKLEHEADIEMIDSRRDW